MNVSVSIVIVNWNGKIFLKDCLESLLGQTYNGHTVILVDNGSTDDSVKFVKETFSNVKLCLLDRNYGFAKGNNLGIKYALENYNPEYILLLNNDTKIVDKTFLNGFIDAAENDKEAGILGCKIVFPDGRTQHLGTRITLLSWEFIKQESSSPYEVDCIMGSVFLIKKAVIDRIGLLDEGFSPFLHEEADYCLRAKKAGFRVKVIPALKVIHYWSGSMNRIPSEEFLLNLYKNSIRLKLLNDPFFLLMPKLALNFFSCVFEKSSDAALGFKLQRKFLGNILLYFKAVSLNVKNLLEIIRKRHNRIARLWY